MILSSIRLTCGKTSGLTTNSKTETWKLCARSTHHFFRIGQYYHELGCKVTNPTEKEREAGKYTKAEAVNHKTAKLKIPLDFPKQRALPSRRR